MPRRRPEPEKRARLADALEKLGWETQDVDSLVDEAMNRARAEIRALRAEPIPDYIKVVKVSDEEAWENAFEAGFLACALAFWDHIAYSRTRRRAAEKGSHTSAAERRGKGHADVLREAAAYRKRNPDATTRAAALHISKRLGMSFDSVRHILRANKPGNN